MEFYIYLEKNWPGQNWSSQTTYTNPVSPLYILKIEIKLLDLYFLLQRKPNTPRHRKQTTFHHFFKDTESEYY